MTFEIYLFGAIVAWVLYVKYYIPAEAGRTISLLDAAIVTWFSWISVLMLLIALLSGRKNTV